MEHSRAAHLGNWPAPKTARCSDQAGTNQVQILARSIERKVVEIRAEPNDLNRLLRPPIPLDELLRNRVLRAAPQSIQALPEEAGEWLRERLDR